MSHEHLRREAATAINALETCVYRLLLDHEFGLRTGEVASLLGLESHVPARNSNWLTRTILEQLVVRGKAVSVKAGSARTFRAI